MDDVWSRRSAEQAARDAAHTQEQLRIKAEREATESHCEWCGEEMGAQAGAMHAACATEEAALEAEKEWSTPPREDGRSLEWSKEEGMAVVS